MPQPKGDSLMDSLRPHPLSSSYYQRPLFDFNARWPALCTHSSLVNCVSKVKQLTRRRTAHLFFCFRLLNSPTEGKKKRIKNSRKRNLVNGMTRPECRRFLSRDDASARPISTPRPYSNRLLLLVLYPFFQPTPTVLSHSLILWIWRMR